MNGLKWAAVSIMALNALLFVSKTGQRRKTITPFDAVTGLIEWAILAALVVLS